VSTAVLLDVDGTLIDSSFHHTIAWYRAFRGHGGELLDAGLAAVYESLAELRQNLEKPPLSLS
jgi:beta-phosphoglucomutase-like phosphatase (HAD superfamily)